jgi:hypothetical protein
LQKLFSKDVAFIHLMPIEPWRKAGGAFPLFIRCCRHFRGTVMFGPIRLARTLLTIPLQPGTGAWGIVYEKVLISTPFASNLTTPIGC